MFAAVGVSRASVAQIGEAAHLIEQPLALQMPGQGHRIAGLIALDESGDGREDQPVVVAVEILGA